MRGIFLPIIIAFVCLTAIGYAQTGGTFNGNYQSRDGVNLEKWDFFSNGEFIHQGSLNFGDFGRTQRGVYRISGSTLVLHIYSRTQSSTVHVPASGAAQWAGQANCSVTHNSTIQLLGANGSQGVVIDGRKFASRFWDRGDKTSAPPPASPPCEIR
jgi:hypothetical protein